MFGRKKKAPLEIGNDLYLRNLELKYHKLNPGIKAALRLDFEPTILVLISRAGGVEDLDRAALNARIASVVIGKHHIPVSPVHFSIYLEREEDAVLLKMFLE